MILKLSTLLVSSGRHGYPVNNVDEDEQLAKAMQESLNLQYRDPRGSSNYPPPPPRYTFDVHFRTCFSLHVHFLTCVCQSIAEDRMELVFAPDVMDHLGMAGS